MQLSVKDIRKGDVFERPHFSAGWTAIDNAWTRNDGHVLVDVRYNGDGGTGFREWDDDSIILEIRRDTT